MPETLSPDEAAARLEPTDTLGIPLGTGQPPAFLHGVAADVGAVESLAHGRLVT